MGAMAAICVVFASCSTSGPTENPPAPTFEHPAQSSLMGVASWYGPGFDGHHTASGEVYNQEQLTAASTVIRSAAR